MKRMQIYIRTGEEDTGRTDSGIGFVIPFPCIRGKFNRILIRRENASNSTSNASNASIDKNSFELQFSQMYIDKVKFEIERNKKRIRKEEKFFASVKCNEHCQSLQDEALNCG